jgi:hypothetical protein
MAVVESKGIRLHHRPFSSLRHDMGVIDGEADLENGRLDDVAAEILRQTAPQGKRSVRPNISLLRNTHAGFPHLYVGAVM